MVANVTQTINFNVIEPIIIENADEYADKITVTVRQEYKTTIKTNYPASELEFITGVGFDGNLDVDGVLSWTPSTDDLVINIWASISTNTIITFNIVSNLV